jgi:hypothetical protein
MLGQPSERWLDNHRLARGNPNKLDCRGYFIGVLCRQVACSPRADR